VSVALELQSDPAGPLVVPRLVLDAAGVPTFSVLERPGLVLDPLLPALNLGWIVRVRVAVSVRGIVVGHLAMVDRPNDESSAKRDLGHFPCASGAQWPTVSDRIMGRRSPTSYTSGVRFLRNAWHPDNQAGGRSAVTRPKHPDKDLEPVLKEAESQNWIVTKGKKYFKMKCPCPDKHSKTVHLSPSDPKYRKNLLAQLLRATCWKEKP
jgi:hypothetical protein